MTADLAEINEAIRRYERTLHALDPPDGVAGRPASHGPARVSGDGSLPPLHQIVLHVLGELGEPAATPEISKHPLLGQYAPGSISTALTDLRKLGLIRPNGTGDRVGTDGRVYGKLNLWERVDDEVDEQ